MVRIVGTSKTRDFHDEKVDDYMPAYDLYLEKLRQGIFDRRDDFQSELQLTLDKHRSFIGKNER
jgi:hypothetical protein